MNATIRPEVLDLCAALCRLGACTVPEVRELVRALVTEAMGHRQWDRTVLTVLVEEGVTAMVRATRRATVAGK